MSSLRVVLLYPPPWKIPEERTAPDPVDGPPTDFHPSDLDADFYQIPYGLLSLAVQTRQAGHAVKVLNLSAYSWEAVEETLRSLDADVFGISCWTANRRGVRLVADCIKRYHPQAHVTLGGPHSTALPRQVLAHYNSVDSVVVGEGEVTFLELLARLLAKQSLLGLSGAYVRDGHRIVGGTPRAAIPNLDLLVSPHESFSTHILMTSRGCPWACTFCGAEASWGRGFRSFSIHRVLDDIEAALSRVPVKILLIKDDTFTTNRSRVLELCRQIRLRNLRFLWSCDTRVDVLSEELVREVRLAGCERMSLGVESGSPSILKAINKRITVAQIEQAASLLRRYGIKARFYMMLGNRGETRHTLEETLAFINRCKPSQYLFSCLSIYPGTHDYEDATNRGWLDSETYFTGRFQELKVPFDATTHDAAFFSEWFAKNSGLKDCHVPDVAELRAVSEALGGNHPPALVELAEALIDEGGLDEAESLLAEAQSLGYPLIGLIYNARACIALRRGNLSAMKECFIAAAKTDPQHYLLLRNAAATKQWFAMSMFDKGVPLDLQARHEFQLFERTEQPTLPGTLPAAFHDWTQSNAITLLPLATEHSTEMVDFTKQGPSSSRRRLPTSR